MKLLHGFTSLFNFLGNEGNKWPSREIINSNYTIYSLAAQFTNSYSNFLGLAIMEPLLICGPPYWASIIIAKQLPITSQTCKQYLKISKCNWHSTFGTHFKQTEPWISGTNKKQIKPFSFQPNNSLDDWQRQVHRYHQRKKQKIKHSSHQAINFNKRIHKVAINNLQRQSLLELIFGAIWT